MMAARCARTLSPRAGRGWGEGVAAWLRIAGRPSPDSRIARKSTSPRVRGEVGIETHYRDAMCARGMLYNAPNNSAERHRVTPEPAVGPAFGSIMPSALFEHDHFGKPVSTFPDHARQIKGKQNAARRMSSDGPHRRQVYAVCANHVLRARLALIAARSPDGVPPRYLRPRTNAAAQLQNALPGTWLSAGVSRRPLSQSSDKVADRSSCRPGVFQLAARERR
jgi:hypothetical protein